MNLRMALWAFIIDPILSLGFKSILVSSLFICFASSTSSAQEAFLFLDDANILSSHFWGNPAAIHDSKVLVAGPVTNSSYHSDFQNPLLVDEEYTLSPIELLGLFQDNAEISNPLSTIDTELMNSAIIEGGPRFVSQRSRLMLFGFSNSYNKRPDKELLPRNAYRVSVTVDRRTDFRYDARFAQAYLDWIADPEVRLPAEAMQEVKLRNQTHLSLNFGQTLELVPLKLSVGYNARFIAGMQRLESEFIGEGDMSLRLSGFESDSLGLLGFRDLSEPLGYGAGLDVGVNLRLTRTWTTFISATDIGFIGWRRRTADDIISTPYDALLSVEPLSNILLESEPIAYPEIPVDQDSYQSQLDTDLNVGFAYRSEGVRASVIGRGSIQNIDFRPNEMEGTLRMSYLFNRFGDTQLELGIGYGYGTDSKGGVLTSAKVINPYFTIYAGVEGIAETEAPYNAVFTVLGLQVHLDGKLRLRPI